MQFCSAKLFLQPMVVLWIGICFYIIAFLELASLALASRCSFGIVAPTGSLKKCNDAQVTVQKAEANSKGLIRVEQLSQQGGTDLIEDDLIEKMKKIEALFARAGTEGERMAAEAAIERMKKRIKSFEQIDPAVEYKFSLNNGWSRRLFVALLRRYGIEPYRRYRQRHTTVMAKVSESFVNQTLWPEFSALDKALQAHLDEITATIIAQAICPDNSDIPEMPAIE